MLSDSQKQLDLLCSFLLPPKSRAIPSCLCLEAPQRLSELSPLRPECPSPHSRFISKEILTIREAVWLTDNTYKYEDLVRVMGEIVSALEGRIRVSRAWLSPFSKSIFLFEVIGEVLGEAAAIESYCCGGNTEMPWLPCVIRCPETLSTSMDIYARPLLGCASVSPQWMRHDIYLLLV